MSTPAVKTIFLGIFPCTASARTLSGDRRASVGAARTRYRSSCSASPALPNAGMPNPNFQARPVFADRSRIRLWPTTRPPGIDNRPPRTFAVLLCLFTHAVNVQCNISEIVPATTKKVARNRSQFPNGRIVSPHEMTRRSRIAAHCRIKFRPYVFRHSTRGPCKRTLKTPLGLTGAGG